MRLERIGESGVAEVSLRELGRSELRETAHLVRRAMRDSPVNIASSAPQAERRVSGALSRFCTQTDERSALSYPERDKPENIRFCQGFGYALVAAAFVTGVGTWFMIRRPRIHCFSKRPPRGSPGARQSRPTAE